MEDPESITWPHKSGSCFQTTKPSQGGKLSTPAPSRLGNRTLGLSGRRFSMPGSFQPHLFLWKGSRSIEVCYADELWILCHRTRWTEIPIWSPCSRFAEQVEAAAPVLICLPGTRSQVINLRSASSDKLYAFIVLLVEYSPALATRLRAVCGYVAHWKVPVLEIGHKKGVPWQESNDERRSWA